MPEDVVQNVNRSTIRPEEVVKDELLGRGSFGEVWKGRCRGQTVAIKILNNQNIDAKLMEEFKREVSIVSIIGHSNVIQYMGACFTPGHLMIVTDYLAKGDLEDMLLNKNISLSMVTRMRMALDVAHGMNWLHCSNPPIIHRDLKTKNLLVGEDNQIKICDFGLSQLKQAEFERDPTNGAKGTPIWMAPEVLSNYPFDEKCDVYSYGLILWCLVTRQEPYSEFEDFAIFRNAIVTKGHRPTIPADCLPRLRNLITRCWSGTPNSRPTFLQIIGELETIVIEYAIDDPYGRDFWARSFKEKDHVPWDEFNDKFQTYYESIDKSTSNLPDNITMGQLRAATDSQLLEFATRSLRNSQVVKEELERRHGVGYVPPQQEDAGIKGLRALLAVKVATDGVEAGANEFVSMEKFGELIKWFGPLFIGTQFVFLTRIAEITSYDWFHGDISQPQAEALIRAANFSGTFLVRFSSQPGCFSVSQSTAQGTIEHRRIARDANGAFVFGQESARTLEELIIKLAPRLSLLKSCSGSRFKSPNPSGYISYNHVPQ